MMQQLGKIFSPRRASTASNEASPKSHELKGLQDALTAAYTCEALPNNDTETDLDEVMSDVEEADSQQAQVTPTKAEEAPEQDAEKADAPDEGVVEKVLQEDMSDVEEADSQPEVAPKAVPDEALDIEDEKEQPEEEALPCDDDMSDAPPAENEHPLSALSEQPLAEEAEDLPCDDDMSDAPPAENPLSASGEELAEEVEEAPCADPPEVPQDGIGAAPKGPRVSASLPVVSEETPGSEATHATPRRQSVASKVAECKARLAELQAMKAQKLEEEDYMGAHEAKQMIQEQEKKLQALRVEGVPTPSDRAAPGSSASAPRNCWRAGEEASESMELCWEGESAGPEGSNLRFALPNDIYDRLYGYQRDGVAWMAQLLNRQHGGVLADEMGLGKTIQVCALLNGARKAGKTHALLLMPVTLLDQWSREARSWCPGWPVYIYYGTVAQRAKALRGIRRPMGGLLLTSYSLAINCEELLQVRVEDVPEPARRRGRPPGAPAAKRRKLDDDDGENEGESEEEPVEPELPGGELPELGSTRPWDLVICDEAHRMKNMSSLLAKSLRGLKSRCRILLTGTPVQNALQDLWALMDFAQPGLLGNHATFVKTFSDPIDRGSVRGAKVWAVELKKHLAEQLRALIAPHLLRRTKTSTGIMGDASEVDAEDVDMEESGEKDVEGVVKKLPSKKETIVWLYPSEEQAAMYKKVLEQSEVVREACNKSKLGIEVFRAIGLLKRLCNHPLLLLQIPKVKDWAELLKEVQDTVPQEAQPEASAGLSEPSEVEPADEVLAGDAEAEAAAGDQAVPSGDESGEAAPSPDVDEMLKTLSRSCQEVLQQSAKLRCLSKLLPDLAAKGHRTLVFSQSVKMLDLVQICCLKPNGLRCLRIDGLTEAQARAEKVAKFNNQPERFQCMLLTTAVGGVGLNLTAADRVVLVDPAWNPATDAQAVDRAYRIGQTKEVRVYRLIMSGLVEDKMFRLQVFKMGLTRTALEADQQHRYFTARFGKLLAAVTQNSPANEPYISYKELKHNISKVSVVCSGKDEDNSSGDDQRPTPQEILESYAASSSSSVLAASSNPKIVGPQQDFFSLLDQDLTAAQLYVQSNVSDVEAMLGEWQVAAVKAGLIFTPQQLEEVQRQLPVHMEEDGWRDGDWLLSLTPGAKTRAARFALVDKYSDIARPLNSLLQYVEVNLTAVRKILKKFDKKIPPEFRMQKASDYKATGSLLSTPSGPEDRRADAATGHRDSRGECGLDGAHLSTWAGDPRGVVRGAEASRFGG
ncbi:unnamed protein product [Durusdinium trenchii]|uniref:DNA excision repair protein ERCC-6-like n=1 Tax=Durusdinium trenchii TaxID=1381693 RepID=A0ABP0N6B8_9DINO